MNGPSACSPERLIEDRMRVSPGQSERWAVAANVGLTSLARLRNGLARIDGQSLTITGEAPDTAVVTAIKQSLSGALPTGYRGRQRLSIRSDAMIWAERERQEREKRERARQKADEEARQKQQRRQDLEAQAERQRAIEAAATAERERLAALARKLGSGERAGGSNQAGAGAPQR